MWARLTESNAVLRISITRIWGHTEITCYCTNVSYSAYEFAVTYSMGTLSYVILLINNSSHRHDHVDQIIVKVPSTDYQEWWNIFLHQTPYFIIPWLSTLRSLHYTAIPPGIPKDISCEFINVIWGRDPGSERYFFYTFRWRRRRQSTENGMIQSCLLVMWPVTKFLRNFYYV